MHPALLAVAPSSFRPRDRDTCADLPLGGGSVPDGAGQVSADVQDWTVLQADFTPTVAPLLLLQPRAAWMLEHDDRSDAQADNDWHHAICVTFLAPTQSCPQAWIFSSRLSPLLFPTLLRLDPPCQLSRLSFRLFLLVRLSLLWILTALTSLRIFLVFLPHLFISMLRQFDASCLPANPSLSTGFTYLGLTVMPIPHLRVPVGNPDVNWSGFV